MNGVSTIFCHLMKFELDIMIRRKLVGPLQFVLQLLRARGIIALRVVSFMSLIPGFSYFCVLVFAVVCVADTSQCSRGSNTATRAAGS